MEVVTLAEVVANHGLVQALHEGVGGWAAQVRAAVQIWQRLPKQVYARAAEK